MKSGYKDFRVYMLILSFVPFVLWIAGAVMLWSYWNNIPLRFLGGGLVAGGFLISSKSPVIFSRMYQWGFASLVDGLDESKWIGLDLEKTGTHDKLHILPDQVGIMIAAPGEYRVVLLDGSEYSIPPDAVFTNVNKGNVSLALQVTDENGQDLLGYAFEPKYRGKQLEIAGYADKRLVWFNKWRVSQSFFCEMPPLPTAGSKS